MGKEKLLFSFDFLVEKTSVVEAECLQPGVEFRLLDFPPQLVQFELCGTRNGGIGISKGKSCVFEMKLNALMRGLRENGVRVKLLDLYTRERKTLGSAVLNISDVSILEKQDARDRDRLGAQCIASGRKELFLRGQSGERVAVVFIRYQLTIIHQSLAHHLEKRPLLNGPTTTRTVCSTENSVQPLDRDQKEEGSLKAAEVPDGKSAEYEDKHELVEYESLDGAEVHQLDRIQNVSSSGSKPDAGSAGGSSTSSLGEDPADHRSLELYLPNSLCPPPLFYHHSEPKSQPCKVTQDNLPSNLPSSHHFHGNAFQFDPEWCVDTTASHWAVLMAHDYNSHPVAVRQRNASLPCRAATCTCTHVNDDDRLNPPEKPPALPLLSSLLEELALLKSHMEGAKVKEPVSSQDDRTEPERATKCLQTDDIPMVSLKPGDKRKQVEEPKDTMRALPPHPGRHGGRFVRECCSKLRKGRSIGLVPKHKSVLYPSDIAHKRTRAPLWKATARVYPRAVDRERTCTPTTKRIVSKTGTPTTKRFVSKKTRQPDAEAVVLSVSNHEEDATLRSSTPTPPVEVLSSFGKESETNKDHQVQKLEVFIPQATPSPDISLPSGSRTSLISSVLERADAETQTEATTTETVATVKPESFTDAQPSTSKQLLQVATANDDSDAYQPSKPASIFSDSGTSNISTPQQSEEAERIHVLSDASSSTEHSKDPEETEDKRPGQISSPLPLQFPSLTSGIDIVITRTPPRRGSLSQECPSPIPHMIMDHTGAFTLRNKPSSLLNIASQTGDSFMSMDSLEVAESAILPMHKSSRADFVYLATSQSTTLSADERDSPASEGDRISNEDELSYSQEYPDDFEQLESSNTDNSTS